MKGKTEFQLSDILIPETGYGRKAKKKGESGENERSYVRKPVGWWVKNSALTHWTRESSTNREFCKPVSKFLLQKPVYVKQDHLFFISYCRHLFVRSDLATLKDMLMHRSQIATAGTPEYARIWNSTADVDLMLYFLWWSEKKKEKKCQDAQNWQPGKIFQLLCGMALPKGVESRLDKCVVRFHLKLHLTSAPWGERLPGGVTSLDHFMAHWLRTWEKGIVPCLSLQIWISCGSPAHQFLNYQAKVMCVHLCMVAVYPFMCI